MLHTFMSISCLSKNSSSELTFHPILLFPNYDTIYDIIYDITQRILRPRVSLKWEGHIHCS